LINKNILLLSFVFLFLAGGVQAEIDRPMRTQQSAPHNLSPLLYVSLPPSNSLLSPEVLQQPLTRRYIAQYTAPGGIAYLNAALERGNIYLPFIKEEIAKRNLPPELAYLPIIESSFIITARSRSGAVGLWQFMMNSISPFNINVNDMIDERRDFIKSTRGALQKLDENYRTLGNWELALAAYNAGLGAVTRMIRGTGINDYWELSRRGEFKQETEHYVPKLLAAAYVLSLPRKYNINVWQTPFEWTVIPLQRQISIDIIAEEAGIDRELLRSLNAQLLHGISPNVSEYHIVVPLTFAEQVNSVLLREDLQLIRYHYHVVRQGDTLWAMSRHYGASLDMIEQHNPGISNRYLRIGETIVVPAFRDTAPPPRSVVNQVFNGTHVVARGETLWSLSRLYGIDPETLATANDMTIDQILREGRALKVPILE
jgi:membrane-bound lytic murein transglycosylase D